jgi:oligopeptide transport system substrate-binding protein
MKAPRVFVTALIAGLILAIACGGDSTSTTTSDDDEDFQVAPADQQVFRVRLTGEPKSIDPHLTNFAQENSAVKPLFMGLFSYDEELKVVPGVAEEMPTTDNGGISKDGLTYTIKLRNDAKWSDGTAMTANDFVYSMKRALDPKLAGPYTSFYHVIKGAKEYNTALGTTAAPKTPSDAELTSLRDAVGVSAKDDKTVVYNLIQPYGSFLDILSIWTAYPVREDVIDRHGSRWIEAGNLIGNGPYVLKDWRHNEKMIMEPNPNWFGETKATVKLDISIIPDAAVAYAAYQNNELDIVSPPNTERQAIMDAGNPLNKELFRRPEAVVFALMMNNKVAPFDNQKVREAFGLAVDRQAFVTVALQGVGRAATSWIAKDAHGWDPDAGKHLEFNATRAKQLLSDAGYPNGQGLPKVTFLFVANDTNRNIIAPFLGDNFKKNLGIDVEFEFVDSPTYQARYTNNQHQVALGGWHYDWNHANNWLPELLGTGGSNNHTNYSSTAFDDLMKRAAGEVDLEKQLNLYKEAQRLALKDVGLAPIYEREVFLLIKPWVKGFTFTGLDADMKGDYNFHRVKIAAH